MTLDGWFDVDEALGYLQETTGKGRAQIISDGDLDRLRDVRREFLRVRGFLLPLAEAAEEGHLDPNGSWRHEGPTGSNPGLQ